MTLVEWLDEAQRIIRRGGREIELSRSEYEELCRLGSVGLAERFCGLEVRRRPPYDWAKESA